MRSSVPTVARLFQIAPIAFGRSALLLAQSGFARITLLQGQLGALFHAVGGFLVQLLGHGGGSPLGAQARNHHGALHRTLAQLNGVASFDLARGFGGLAIHRHPALVDVFTGQGAGFVKTGRPQPFVDAHFLHGLIVTAGQTGWQVRLKWTSKSPMVGKTQSMSFWT